MRCGLSRQAFCLAVATLFAPASGRSADDFTRGDVNTDGDIDIADPIFLLTYVFSGGEKPICPGIADTNSDGGVDISDGITLLTYLFSNPKPLLPLSEDELDLCRNPPPDIPVPVRHGTFEDVINPPHGVAGTKVEEYSDGTIQVTNFNYDGLGFPHVVFYLTREPFANTGYVVSEDLLRDTAYLGEKKTLRLPPGVRSRDFGYVSVWCDSFPLHYAIAKLFDGPLP